MPFTKIHDGILNSSLAADYEVRHLFEDLLKLCDWKTAHIDMTYETIASRLRLPSAKVILGIRKLCEPDPESRSKKCEGRRLIPLDPARGWGWKVVNWEAYQDQRDETERRAYMRELMRERRKKQKVAALAKKAQNDGSLALVNKPLAPVSTPLAGDPPVSKALADKPDSPRETVSTPLAPVSTPLATLAHADVDSDIDVSTPPAVPQGGPQQAAEALNSEITDPEEFRRLVNERILKKDPGRAWGSEAMRSIARWLPCPRIEVERIAWWRNLPNDGTPELEARKFVTESGLMLFWSDEYSRANNFWQMIYGWRKNKSAEAGN